MDSVNFKYVLLFLLFSTAFVVAENTTNSSNSTGNATLNASLNTSSSATNASVSKTPEKTLIEKEVEYYLNPGEKFSKIINFTHNGDIYYMVLVGGKEYFLFNKNLALLSTAEQISPVLSSYISSSLVLPFGETQLTALKTNFASLENATLTCLLAYDDFKNDKYVCLDDAAGFRKYMCGFMYKGEYNFLIANYSFLFSAKTGSTKPDVKAPIESALPIFNRTIGEMAELVSKLDADFKSLSFSDLQKNILALDVLVDEYETAYLNFSPAHTLMLTHRNFAKYGKLDRCSIDKAKLDGVQAQVNLGNSFPAISGLSDSLTTIFKARETAIAIRKDVLPRKDKLSAFSSSLAQFLLNFSKVNNGQPTFLVNSKDAMTKYLDAALAANSTSVAKTNSDKFDSSFELANKTLKDSIDVFSLYNESFFNVAQAEAGLAEAYRKYGNVDPRVLDLDNQTKYLRTRFELKESDLKAGRSFSKADFEYLALTASDLASQSTNLQSSQNDLDLVYIVGGILALAVIIGIFWYIKKSKKTSTFQSFSKDEKKK